MPSPLETLARARYLERRSGGVSFQPPIRVQRGRVAPRGRPDDEDDGSSIVDKFRARPDIMSNPAFNDGGGGGGLGGGLSGLGWVIGNPVSKAVLGGLTAFDYPRAAIVAATREALDTQPVEWFNQALATLPGVDYSPIQSDNPGWDWGELWENTKERKGFGELIVEPAMGPEGTDRNIWIRRLAGFAGDLASDPLSYMALGTGAQTGLKARSAYMNTLRGAQRDVAEQIARHEAVLANAAKLEQRGTGSLGAISGRAEAALPALRQRAGELGGDEALNLIGRQGVNRASAAQQRAMGLDPTGLRVGGFLGFGQGVAMPRTGGLGRGFARTTGPLKGALSNTALARGTRALRMPLGYLGQDLAPSFERIVSGNTGASIHPALNAVELNEWARIAGGGFRSKARRELAKWLREIKDLDGPARMQMIREAEEEGAENIFTKLAPRMREVARSVGVEIPEIAGGGYVMPHILSREAYNFLGKLRRGQDPLAEQFSSAFGLTVDDLLEESGFLQKRSLRPDPVTGEPMKLKMGDETIEITKGSIAELEDKLGGILRNAGFKGQLYETSPTEAWLKYIEGTRRDVAKRAAFTQGAERGMAGLARAGPKPERYDPYGGRRLMATDAQGNVVTQPPPPPVPGRALPPPVVPEGARFTIAPNPMEPPENQFYEMVEDVAATKKRARDFGRRGKTGREQRQLVSELTEAANAERAATASTFDQAAQEAWDTIQGQRRATAQEATSAQAAVTSLEGAQKYLGLERDLISKQIDEANVAVRKLQSRIGQIKSTAGRRAQRRGAKLGQKLLDELDALGRQIEALEAERAAALAVTDEDVARAWAQVEGWSERRQQLHLRDLKNRITRTEPRLSGGRDMRGSKVRYEEALEEARLARRAKGWVEESDFEAAQRVMNNPNQRQGYADAKRAIDALSDDRKRLLADAQRLDAEAQELRRQAASGTGKMSEKRQNALRAKADKAEADAVDARTQAYDKLVQRKNAEDELGKHPLVGAHRTTERWYKQLEDIEKGQGASLLGDYDVAALRAQYEDDVRELHAFGAAMKLKKEQGRIPPTAAERIEADAARAAERLQDPKLQEFMDNETRLAVLDDEIAALRKQQPDERLRKRPLSWQKNSPGSYSTQSGDVGVTIEKGTKDWRVTYSSPEFEPTTHPTLVKAKLAAEKTLAETPEYRTWKAQLDSMRDEHRQLKEFVEAHPARAETIRAQERSAQRGKRLSTQRASIDEANAFLQSEPAQKWRAAQAQRERLDTRVNAAKPTRAGRTSGQYRADLAEWKKTRAAADEALERVDGWLARNTEVGQRVQKAERLVASTTADIEKTAPPLPQPGVNPEMRRIEQQEQERLTAAIGADVAGRNVEKRYDEAIVGAQAGEAGQLRRIGGQEMGEVVDTGQGELDAAMKRLQAPQAQQVYTNRERLRQIEQDLLRLERKPAPVAGRDLSKPQRQPYLRPYQRDKQAALRAEHRQLTDWFRSNAKLIEQVRTDEGLIGAAIRPGPTPSGAQLMEPIGTRGPSQAGITLEEAAEALPKVAGTEQAIEAQRSRVVELQQALHEVDEDIAYTQDAYLDARNNLPAAMDRHREFEAKLQGLERPRSMGAMSEASRAGQPYNTALRGVQKGEVTPFEAQPMHDVVDDMNKLVAANPSNDDDLINRMQAVMAATEASLAKTTETDMTAYQVSKALKDAENGKLAEPLKAQLKSSLEYVWEGGDVVITKDLKRMYFNISRAVESKRFGRALTLFTDFFKTYATLTPGFHIRNALSAIFMNSTEGVTLGTQIRAVGLWKQYMDADNPTAWIESRPQAVRDAFHATFASGAGGQFLESGVSELRSGSQRALSRVFNNPATRVSQQAGQWVEGPARLALALDSTMRGADTMAALQRVTRVHFDYSEVSRFDETMKRWVPFWTFMSRNIPLQFTQMWTKPRAYNRFQSFARNFSVEPPEFMPEYIEQLGGFDTGVRTPGWMEKIPLAPAAAGMPVVLQADLPHMRLQEDIRRAASALSGENPGQVFSDLNPLYTAPYEWMTGTDIYTGKRYGPDDISEVQPWAVPLAAALSLVGGAEQGPGGKYYMDDKTWNTIMSLIPPLERQSRLLPNMVVKNKDKNDRQFESYARFLGAPIRTISEKQMQAEQASRYYDQVDLMQKLAAMGG